MPNIANQAVAAAFGAMVTGVMPRDWDNLANKVLDSARYEVRTRDDQSNHIPDGLVRLANANAVPAETRAIFNAILAEARLHNGIFDITNIDQQRRYQLVAGLFTNHTPDEQTEIANLLAQAENAQEAMIRADGTERNTQQGIYDTANHQVGELIRLSEQTERPNVFNVMHAIVLGEAALEMLGHEIPANDQQQQDVYTLLINILAHNTAVNRNQIGALDALRRRRDLTPQVRTLVDAIRPTREGTYFPPTLYQVGNRAEIMAQALGFDGAETTEFIRLSRDTERQEALGNTDAMQAAIEALEDHIVEATVDPAEELDLFTLVAAKFEGEDTTDREHDMETRATILMRDVWQYHVDNPVQGVTLEGDGAAFITAAAAIIVRFEDAQWERAKIQLNRGDVAEQDRIIAAAREEYIQLYHNTFAVHHETGAPLQARAVIVADLPVKDHGSDDEQHQAGSEEEPAE